MKETWKDVIGFEGVYQVSNQGNVKSLPRKAKTYYGERTVKGNLMIPCDNGNGYKYVSLSRDGIVVREYIHRLVGKAFVNNPDKKPQINHINGNKSDNRAENLEWVTDAENQLHASRTGLNVGNSMSKINIVELEMIKDLIRTDKYSSTEICKRFGISTTMFFKVKKFAHNNDSNEKFEKHKSDKNSHGKPIIVFEKKSGETKRFISGYQASKHYKKWDGYFSDLINRNNGENINFKAEWE